MARGRNEAFGRNLASNPDATAQRRRSYDEDYSEMLQRLDHGAHHSVCQRGAWMRKPSPASSIGRSTRASHGLVPVGTTGESPTVSHEEHRRVIEICVEVADKRVPVIAGAGSNSTAEAVSLARFAEEIGADAVLSVVPYYNKPTQEGLFQHFSAVAQADGAADHPLLACPAAPSSTSPSTPSRGCARRMPTSSASRMRRRTWSAPACSASSSGTDFILLSGEDMTALGFNAHGGHGCISVTSNVAPRLCSLFQNACQQGNFVEALALQDKLVPAAQGLFIETNPGRHQVRRRAGSASAATSSACRWCRSASRREDAMRLGNWRMQVC